MQKLLNNCELSKISVTPENWQSPKAKLNCTWEISYRFKNENQKKPVQKRITVPKKYNTHEDRKLFIEGVLKFIEEEIVKQGYNPITKSYFNETAIRENKDENVFTLKTALEKAFTDLKVDARTISDIKSALNYIYPAIEQLHFASLPVEKISRKHAAEILDMCGKIKVKTSVPVDKKGKTKPGVWTADTFNHYRLYLSKLFSDMVKKEWIEYNPVLKVEKEKTIIRIRQELTYEERNKVNQYLFENHPSFWRFCLVFFHSGCRIIELLGVRKNDIDLERGRFKVLVKKRKGNYAYEWRTIKKEAIQPEWEYLFSLAKPGQFIFSRNLMPGDKRIRRDQVTRRWKVHVKDKLGIEADIYSLKHSNLDEIADDTMAAQEALRAAQQAAGHLSSNTTKKHYLKGQDKREHELLRKINNKFSMN